MHSNLYSYILSTLFQSHIARTNHHFYHKPQQIPYADLHISINQILGIFETVFTSDENAEIDEEYLMQNFKLEYCAFLEYGNEIKYAYRVLMESGYLDVSERFPSKFGNIDNAFIDRKGGSLQVLVRILLKRLKTR